MSDRAIPFSIGRYATRRHRPGTTALARLGAGLIAAGIAVAQAGAAEPLTIQGSTTFFARLLEPNAAEIEQTSGAKLSVIANKSIWGLIALLEKRADMAMISGDLTGEIEVAKKTAPHLPYAELRQFEVARVRVAFPVHPSNPVRSLTMTQLKGILLGNISNWQEVGGADLEIRVVATQDGGGTIVALRAALLDGQPIAARNSIRLESAGHVVRAVTQEAGALGVAQLGLVREMGLPEVATDVSVEQSLSFVTLGQPSSAMKAVIDATHAIAKRELM